MFNITEEQLNMLVQIYNTMLQIDTKGENTLIMADCLRALEQVVRNVNENKVKEDKE